MTHSRRFSISLSKLRFTQKSISAHFKDGRHIDTLAGSILVDHIDYPHAVPRLRVVRAPRERTFYSLDNRRLACFCFVAHLLDRDIRIRCKRTFRKDLSALDHQKLAESNGECTRLRRTVVIGWKVFPFVSIRKAKPTISPTLLVQ